MSWEKIGATIVAKLSAHGSGLYVRIPKRICQAYELYTAEVIEVRLERARKPPVEESTPT